MSLNPLRFSEIQKGNRPYIFHTESTEHQAKRKIENSSEAPYLRSIHNIQPLEYLL